MRILNYALVIAPLLLVNPAQAAKPKTPSAIRDQIKRELVRLDKPSVKMMSDSQAAVATALASYGEAYTKCELGLLAQGTVSAAAVDHAPSWLIEAARRVFVQKRELDAGSLSAIENHKFLTEVGIHFVQNAQLVDEAAVKTDVIRALLDTVPLQNDAGERLSIQISNLERKTLSNTLNFKLRIAYDNGETRMLQFRNLPVGVIQPEARVAQVIVAAIHHRVMLSNEEALRQEMNAIGYNLKKLLRVTTHDVEPKIGRMIKALERAQPKSRFYTSWVNGNRYFVGTDTMMGQAFTTLLEVKQELIEMAQRAKEEEVKAARAAKVAPDADFVASTSSVNTRGRSSSGYYVPRHSPAARASSSSSSSTSDDSDYMATVIWIHDPMFMLTRPWYWGTKDGTFYSHWMMYDWMQDRSRRAEADAKRRYEESIFRPEQPYQSHDMRRFDEPVEPVYTRDAARPVLDPWTTEGQQAANSRQAVVVAIDESGAAAWTEARSGRGTDVYTSSREETESAWGRVTGQPVSTSQPTTRELEEDEGTRLQSGNSGSAWGSQPAAAPSRDADDFKTGGSFGGGSSDSGRDTSIKSY